MVAGEDVFHNCQPQPCAARAARPASVHTVEPFSQAGEVFAGNADVRRLGLADYFRFALSAEELGVGKPDPRPFEQALRLSSVSAGQAVHIGDHPGDDIAGALSAGMRAIWFNPQGKAWEGERQAHAEIRNLAELPDTLKRLGSYA